ncbi:MAG: very short patch repair endonuclease [Thermomicrobiales bacterium]
MQSVKSKNTKPEWTVRHLLHRLGYRYRLHVRNLPGKPDIVFTKKKKAIFVHGCYWHGHGCRIGQPPKSNLEYWLPKIAANRERDTRKQREIESLGWSFLVVWQCETKDLIDLESRLTQFLGDPQSSRAK